MARTILLFGFSDIHSPRHRNIRLYYEGKGYTVRECHTDRRGLFGKCIDLVRIYRREARDVSTVVVMFPGHYIVWLAWILTRFPRKHLVFDAFISVYDTLVIDRKKVHRGNPYAWLLWCIDALDCRMADEVLIDTQTHKEYFSRAFHLHPAHITVVYLEAPADLFHPRPHAKRIGNTTVEVLFYGSYIPLQGIETILHAASMLQHENTPVHFTLVGSGQTYSAMRLLATELKLSNVTFSSFVPLAMIPAMIHDADITLGIFGTGEKTQRVIPHKVIECIACGATVITADTPAMRERHRDGIGGVHLIPAGDPKALAGKILELCKR